MNQLMAQDLDILLLVIKVSNASSKKTMVHTPIIVLSSCVFVEPLQFL